MKTAIFNLTEEQYERLAKSAKKMGVSKTVVLRQVIELYCIIKEAQQETSVHGKGKRDGQESIVKIIG